jgi:hypothetical protein
MFKMGLESAINDIDLRSLLKYFGAKSKYYIMDVAVVPFFMMQ